MITEPIQDIANSRNGTMIQAEEERMTKESYDLDGLKEALTTLPDKE
ncbi:hypothetical protein IJM16_02125 [Candidatus Saccharibacteria bacterium]|nr:hypothetical protein [Candidatus Saccharibacteria bacterium]